MSTVSIPLSQGKYFTLIDEEDYERVSAFAWRILKTRNRRYAYRACRRQDGRWTSMYLHRFIMEVPEDMEVDHINGDGLCNVRSNLRLCTHAENLRNSRPYRGTSSQFKGVGWDKSRNKWIAKVRENGKTRNLGRFDDELDAARAYDAAAREVYGEFARLNFPDAEYNYTYPRPS